MHDILHESRSFLHAYFFEYMKVVENAFKKSYGEDLIYGKDTCVSTTYVTENK